MMHPAPADFRTADSLARRDRIYAAMLDLVADQGYEATSIEEVSERAGCSREDFEREFKGIQECAFWVFDRIVDQFNATVEAAYAAQPAWRDALRAAAYAAARYQRDHPRETRFGALEFLWVGELARARREATFQRFVDLIDAGRSELDDPDSVARSEAEGVIGSIAEMLTKSAGRGEVVDPEKYVPQLMYFAVLPYLGPEAAAEELEMPPPPES
jgi:AcrR family transcriptional regulator